MIQNKKKINKTYNHLEIPNRILEEPLTLGDKFMFGFITQIINIKFSEGKYPNFILSNNKIAKKLNISPVVASRNIGHLRHKGYIKSSIVGRNHSKYSGVQRHITLTRKGRRYNVGTHHQEIPDSIIKFSNLSLSKQLLLGYFITFYNRSHIFFESNSSIASHLKIDISSVRRGMKFLNRRHDLYKVPHSNDNKRRYLAPTTSLIQWMKSKNKVLEDKYNKEHTIASDKFNHVTKSGINGNHNHKIQRKSINKKSDDEKRKNQYHRTTNTISIDSSFYNRFLNKYLKLGRHDFLHKAEIACHKNHNIEFATLELKYFQFKNSIKIGK